VVACGVATLVTTRTAYDSLVVSRDTYYAEYRFADVFATCKRAPDPLVRRLAAIPGVAEVRTRLVFEVTLDVPGLAEPATGRVVSVPEHRAPILNDLHLRSGRWLLPGRRDEALVSDAFAEANGLDVGDSVGAILNGRWQELRVVGVALSPEYVFAVGAGDLLPDKRRFGVLWMSHEAMGPAFDLDGAFNDVVATLAPGASERAVLDEIDRVLEDYGGHGAYGRIDQISHQFLNDEIRQNRVTGTVLPGIFLGVAAFLLHVVLARLVSLQRDQIGTLKAFGYSDLSVAIHFLEFAGVAVALGSALGVPVGLWLGRLVNELYTDFYRFPVLRFAADARVVGAAVGVAALSAGIGALASVRRVLALPPAEAMRPEAPARFHGGVVDRLRLRRLLPMPARMIVRNLARRPVRAGLSVLGLALAVALLLVGRFMTDALQALLDVQFREVQRDDATVAFHEPLTLRARFELRHLPGVLGVEIFRSVPVRVRSEYRSRRTALLGLESGAELRRLVDARHRVFEVPAEGVLLTGRLADLLGVEPGQSVRVEVLEGSRPVRDVRVAGRVDELMGLAIYMEARALARLLRETPSVSGAHLAVDARDAPALHAELKRTPAVRGVMLRETALQSFDENVAGSMKVMNTIVAGFACVIAFAVIYNAARIALSERGRELASLRVLGFTRREIAWMLLGEQALLLVFAIPVGFAIGYRTCAALVGAYQTELFRLPLALSPRSFAFALLVVGAAALVSGAVVRRRLDRLDLVAVLKTRE
jgi:putative ABC transport system permease protein